MKRLRELDFLRGVAIVLVLLRHQHLSTYTVNMGWIGVDLFFVLSGFLVSGLLFQEYLKFGNIKPGLFLVRRGFKIYPIYYLTYPIYILLNINNLSTTGIAADLTFTQNYIVGWGFAYPASWSLAVEEHFYFGLTLVLWYCINYKKRNLQASNNHFFSVPKVIISIMAVCLILRLLSNYYSHNLIAKNNTMTHLRIDSLLAGVFIAYCYYFKLISLQNFFTKYKKALLVICFAGLSWTPFIVPLPSYFVKTIGFTLLFISFGILLLYFLLTPDINQKINKIFSTPVVTLFSKIGYCSYSIYIIHTFINALIAKAIIYFNLPDINVVNFIASVALSVIAGIFMTYKIEKYFLTLRNKWYPGRTQNVMPVNN